MRLTAIVVGVVAVATACGGEAPLSEAEMSELEFESAEQGLTARDESALIEDIPVLDVSIGVDPGDLDLGFDQTEQNKCSPQKQMACDQCLASCDELCPITEGKLPTRCTACQRGCSASCAKCVVF